MPFLLSSELPFPRDNIGENYLHFSQPPFVIINTPRTRFERHALSGRRNARPLLFYKPQLVSSKADFFALIKDITDRLRAPVSWRTKLLSVVAKCVAGILH